jgi:DNA mismatch repair protein MutS
MNSLRLVASRHPVVEQTVKKSFTPNDILLTEGGILLLTGPNMAGKSTLMRQLALTSILAQIGSFVPADVAELPIFDSIFTRVGASDNLSEGLSTFMVEMTETADMLRKATPKSLLILDEIGRGTSTFDGMSLAQSILEYLASDLKAMTLFATHYHELTETAQSRPQILNMHMSIEEHQGKLIFLRNLKVGPANRSYGIEVAKQAGLPLSITKRAAELLKSFTKKSLEQNVRQLDLLDQDFSDDSLGFNEEPASNPQDELNQKFIEEFKSLSIENLTPIQALNQLHELKSKLDVEKH